MKHVNGVIRPQNTENEVLYIGHSLTIRYIRSAQTTTAEEDTGDTSMQRQAAPQKKAIAGLTEQSIEIAQNGTFSFEIHEEEEISSQVTLSLRGPISQFYSIELAYEDLGAVVDTGTDTSLPLEIIAEPQQPAVVEQDNQLPSYKVKGRLLNFDDGTPVENKTLFIHLHFDSQPEETPQAEIGVFDTTKTDSAGYFSFMVSGEPLRQGFLKIAGLEDAYFNLEMDTGDATRIAPNQVIVVDGAQVDLLENEEDDCGCNGTKDEGQRPDAEDLALSGAYTNLKGKNCVDFTQPNRSLEEFSYVKLVRTTEPDFKKIPYQNPPLLKVPGGSDFSQIISRTQPVTDDPNDTSMERTAEETEGTEMEGDSAPEARMAQPTQIPDLRAFYLFIQNSWVDNTAWWIFDERPFELIDTKRMVFEPLEVDYPKYDPVSLWKNTVPELYEYIYQTTEEIFEGELLKFVKFLDQEFRRENRRQCANPAEMESFIKWFFQEGSRGRVDVDGTHGIDWDDSPTLYQNTSIAHGHILHFKQVWRADGYSMGDLLYSLPLAPAQKKQIAIYDWDRGESAGRSESLLAEDQLSAHLSRDRDVTDIVNSSLSESIKGGSETELYSKSKTAGIGGGIGSSLGGSASLNLPASPSNPVSGSGAASLGVSGGIAGGFGTQTNESNSSSSAWQDSARDISATSMNNLKDSIMQSASSIRSQRSTVIETVSQNESMQVQTEVIANNNHCHSMTVQYFEVLRHFAIDQKLADVQECLFVPLEMSAFTAEKILRWKDELYGVLPGSGLREGILALEEIQRKYRYADAAEVLADEMIQEMYGEFVLSLNINRPKDPEPVQPNESSESGSTVLFHGFEAEDWKVLERFMGSWNTSKIRSNFDRKTQEERDKIWEQEILPEIMTNFLDQLEIDAFDQYGNPLSFQLEMSAEPNMRSKFDRRRGKAGLKKKLKIDRLRSYTPGNELRLIVRLFPSGNGASRKDIQSVKIKNQFDLPEGSQVTFFGGQLRYETDSLKEVIVSEKARHLEFTNDQVSLNTPLNKREKFSPIREAYKTANRLIEHINDHLEYYHKVIWFRMDPDKRYMMLDGFTAPNADGRSVASVIENKLIDIVGNNLVLPVARGVRIDPQFKQEVTTEVEGEFTTELRPIDLMKHYAPTTPLDPYRISVPTRGVYAEAVMGHCNSCEHIDESRHWRFTEVPHGNEPTAIQPISTDTRRAAPSDLTAKDLSNPIINIQNAPDAPAPQGFAGALDALTRSNAFNNLTGLDQNQLNALEALKQAAAGSTNAFNQSLEAAEQYAKMAKEIAMHASSIKNSDKTARAIENQRQKGNLSETDAKELQLENLKSRIPSLMKDSDELPRRDIDSLIPDNPSQFEEFEATDMSGSSVSFTSNGGMAAGKSQGIESLNSFEDSLVSGLELQESKKWLTLLSKDGIKLASGSEYDDSYMQAGARVKWEDSAGRANTILIDSFRNIENFMVAQTLDVSSEQVASLGDSQTISIDFGALYVLNTSGTYLLGENWLHDDNVLPIQLQVSKKDLNGFTKYDLSLSSSTENRQSNETSLFSHWYKEQENPIPFSSIVECFLIKENGNQRLFMIVRSSSAPVEMDWTDTSYEYEKNSSGYGFSAYFGADSENNVNLEITIKGSDIVEIIATDGYDSSSNGGDSPTISVPLWNNAIFYKIMNEAFGGVRKDALEALLNGTTLNVKADLNLTLGLFAAYYNKSEQEFVNQVHQTSQLNYTSQLNKQSTFVIALHDDNPFAGHEVPISVSGFATGSSTLSEDQKQQVRLAWNNLNEDIKAQILKGDDGVLSIQPIGSASNLDYANDPDDLQNIALAEDRANSLIGYLKSSEVMGNSFSLSDMDAITQESIVFHKHAEVSENDNQPIKRYAEVKIILK